LTILDKKKQTLRKSLFLVARGQDLNLRPSGYEVIYPGQAIYEFYPFALKLHPKLEM
jgi:hypothetical protein